MPEIEDINNAQSGEQTRTLTVKRDILEHSEAPKTDQEQQNDTSESEDDVTGKIEDESIAFDRKNA